MARRRTKAEGWGTALALSRTIDGFADGGSMRVKYTCSGGPNGLSPHMQWSNVPATAASFAEIFHDPSVILQKRFADSLHCIVFNIPSSARKLPEGVPGREELERWGASD
jgi:phosphatidylethanolamine-binding protein (PEBP) family uncharacterized protein